MALQGFELLVKGLGDVDDGVRFLGHPRDTPRAPCGASGPVNPSDLPGVEAKASLSVIRSEEFWLLTFGPPDKSSLSLIEHMCYYGHVDYLEASPKTKRKRGGQKGNHNSRKHGFYSRTLTPDEICEFWNIANTKGIEPEVAVLLVKLRRVLRHDPGNRRAIGEATKLLTKWYSAKYRLTGANRNYLRKGIRAVLEFGLAHTERSDCDRSQKTGFSQNESSALLQSIRPKGTTSPATQELCRSGR